jgi:surfeit locus 1 family protein
MLRGRDWGLVVGAVVVASVCVRLGVWQLDRLAERRARNAEIGAARERPPLEIGGAGLPAGSVANRRVTARGVYDYDHERVWRGRTYQGMPGVHLVTPLRLADGSAVLVDRGFVPSPDAARIDLPSFRGPDSALVEGLGVALPRGRGDVDPARMQDSVPYPLARFGIQLRPSPSVSVRPRPSLSRPPIALEPSPLSNGPHLAYAVQWFSFAIIAVAGTAALLLRGGVPPR